ncbi:MAG TPA: hypothetical protein VL563_05350 [Gemmatimonadales bacterium]|jgi:hypothetical protein|nr:hypothetical protein [Gemmatimonadales bacterium]
MADLRPMEFGEILDGALQLFRRHFGLFLKLSLAVMWLPLAFSIYWRARFFGLATATPEQTAAVMQSQIVPFMLWGMVWGVLYGAGMLLLTAGSIRVISDSYLGREPQFGDSLQFGVGKIVPLFLVGLGKTLLLFLLLILSGVVIGLTGAAGGLAVLLVFIEVIAAVWLFIYVACGYMVTTPVVVLETLSSNFDAFGRSWELTKGARGRVFGLVFVAGLISSVLPALVLSALGALIAQLAPAASIAWTVIAAVLPVVLTPIVPCVLTLAYYDLRVRHEGFDLQLLSEQLGSV